MVVAVVVVVIIVVVAAAAVAAVVVAVVVVTMFSNRFPPNIKRPPLILKPPNGFEYGGGVFISIQPRSPAPGANYVSSGGLSWGPKE